MVVSGGDMPRVALPLPCSCLALRMRRRSRWRRRTETAIGGRFQPPGCRSKSASRSTACSTKPVWQRADPAADFIQIDPDNGRPATEPTEVRIVFDERRALHGRHRLRLRAGQVARLPAAPRRVPRLRRPLHVDDRHVPRRADRLLLRDEPVGPDGRLAARRQRRQPAVGRHLERARARAATSAGRSRSRSRSARSTSIPNSDTWGINFQRTVRRKNEDSIWMGWARNQGLRRHDERRPRHRHPRRRRRAAASTSSRTASSPSQASPGRGSARARSTTRNAGVDLFYNPTPRLRANLTINTDFAQTEVDQRQVNLDALLAVLSREARLLPRRRDLLRLRQPGGNADLRVNPFFSRRIGLSADAHAAEDRLRHQAHRPGRRPGRRRPARADRRRRRRRLHRRGLHGGARQAPAAARSPTSARIYTRRDARGSTARRRAAHRRPRLPPRDQSASSARRTSKPPAGSCTPRGRASTGGNSAFGASSTIRTTAGTRGFDATRGAGELRPGGRLRHPPRLSPLLARSRLPAAAARTTATSGSSSSAAELDVQTDLAQRPAHPRRSTSR